MKKKLAMIAMVALTMGILAGCGADNEAENNDSNAGASNNAGTSNSVSSLLEDVGSVADMKVEDYVTIGDYKNLTVTVKSPEVTGEDIENHMQAIYNSNMSAESGVTDRAVAMGDTVNIDYEGKKDGVAFAGGTATDQQLGIGSGQFIDGFEEGLVGVKPGETVDLNLTFPAAYHSADLAGQAVVFTVKVNYIYPGVEQYTDAEVASWGNESFSTVEEMRQFSSDYLNNIAQTDYESEVEVTVLETFLSQCEFKELPKALVEKYRTGLQSTIEYYASIYSMDTESFCQYAYGMGYEQSLETGSTESAKQVLAFQAVANQENLTMTDEELEQTLQEFATQKGMASVEELLGTNTREDYRELYMYEDVIAFLIENAVVTAE